MKHLIFGAGLLCAVFHGTLAHSDTIILRKDAPGNSGIQIAAGGWTEAAHTDLTYRVYKKIHAGPLSTYDFYYQMKIVPQFNPSHGWCSDKIDVGTFFNGLFGISDAALAVLKATIHYNYTSGQFVDFSNTSVPLLMVGRGSAPGGLTPGNGCYFDLTPSVEYPLIRYEGGGVDQDYDDFDIKFSVNGGKALTLNAVATIAALFSNFNAAFAWAQIKSAEVTALQSAAQTFQQALAAAGTSQDQVPTNFTMKLAGTDQGRLQISIPSLFGKQAPQGNLVIYVRRSASIVFDTSQSSIDSGSVLANDRLAGRQCSVSDIAKGACVASKTIRFALADAIKPLDATPPLNIFDPNTAEKQAKIYDLCQLVRTHLRETFHLSTLDEMIVRWALTKESGLQAAFSDPTKKAAIASATKRPADEVVSMCWNDGDSKTLASAASALNITLK
jgi:hypothetical protein